MNQEQFWTQIGVTQSGGSRYESGREMPRPVKELLRLVHVEQIDLSQVKRVDFEIISYLKEAHPDLYRNLRRAARSRTAGQEPPAFADVAVPAVGRRLRTDDSDARRADRRRPQRLILSQRSAPAPAAERAHSFYRRRVASWRTDEIAPIGRMLRCTSPTARHFPR